LRCSAYEENLADYHCKGVSAGFSVVVCGALVTLMVCFKMLAEERRALCSRIVLMRHATETPLFYSLYHLLFGKKRLRALKLLLFSVFQSFREYGVLTFVYVAAIEQLMLFETILLRRTGYTRRWHEAHWRHFAHCGLCLAFSRGSSRVWRLRGDSWRGGGVVSGEGK
jgi:hypothetical protein